MRGFQYLWNCAICLKPAQCGLILEDQYRDTDSLYQYTYFDTAENIYWLRCPYCQHSFHKNCATNLSLGEIEYYGWACCREIDYTVFRGGLIPNRDVLTYIDVIRLLYTIICGHIFGNFSVFFSVFMSKFLSCRSCVCTTDTDNDLRLLVRIRPADGATDDGERSGGCRWWG